MDRYIAEGAADIRSPTWKVKWIVSTEEPIV